MSSCNDVDADACLSVAIHRDYSGLDDRRNRPAALVDLRIDADVSGHIRPSIGRQRRFHTARIPWFVCLACVLFLFLIGREIERGPEPLKSDAMPTVAVA